MGKKKYEHGPLYQHAKRELELLGLSNPKGANDTLIYSTTLRLIDTLERGTRNEFQRNAVSGLFGALSDGMALTEITDDPNEWEPAPGVGDNVLVNKRCNKFFSRDGGSSWVRGDNNSSGISKKVHIEKETTDANETQEDIQPDPSI